MANDPVLTAITVQDFKDRFYRDGFSYLPYSEWLSTIIYNTDNEAYYRITKKVYKCLNDNVNTPPTNTTDWIAENINVFDYTLNEDIERAFADAFLVGSFIWFTSNESKIEAYLLLSAHILYLRLKEQDSQDVIGNTASTSVGSVSESINQPQWTLEKKNFYYSQSTFGIKYQTLLDRYYIPAPIFFQGSIN